MQNKFFVGIHAAFKMTFQSLIYRSSFCMCQLPWCYSRRLLCSEVGFSRETVCARMCVCACMLVFVWPCVPLSAVILPASGFDKNKHCGGKWINSCLHFVTACMLRSTRVSRPRLHHGAFSYLACAFSWACLCQSDIQSSGGGGDITWTARSQKWMMHYCILCTETFKQKN